jgi:ABC-type hemin transport system substrate-binding protein
MKFKLFRAFLIALLCVFIFGNCRESPSNEAKNGVNVINAEGKTAVIADASRIVSAGAAVTETIYPLGAGEKLVGIDNSSAEYIPETKICRKSDRARRFRRKEFYL